MNRRDFMRRMFGLTVTIAVSPNIVAAFNKSLIDATNPSLYGIDYGLNDATIGTWMGLTRSNVAQWNSKVLKGTPINPDMVKMIKKLMDDAVDKNWEIIIANDEQTRLYEKGMEKDLLSKKDSIRMVPDMPK